MAYVDGFVAAVPTARKQDFLRHARIAAEVFKDNGALQIVECWGDDVAAGTLTSFPRAVQKKDDETVVFSWITWASREIRNEAMQKAMSDPRLSSKTNPMPFDGTRMIYGGFEIVFQA
jgi:uncharacterized protein YbaA (DUF1428 family)